MVRPPFFLRSLFHPVVNFGREEFPKPPDFVCWHLLALNSFADRVAIDAPGGGNFSVGQPALLHKGFSGFSASESFPMRRAFGQHCRNSIRSRQRKTKKAD
jgi:hypothetical protein